MFKSNDMLIPMTKYSVEAFFKVLIIPIVFSHGTGIKGVHLKAYLMGHQTSDPHHKSTHC